MAEEEKKKEEGKKEVEGKGLVVLIPFVVVVAIVFAIGVGVKSYEASKKIASSTTNTTPQQKWGLCWEDHEEKRCGIVKKIVFYDFNGSKKIIKMETYYPSTGVTANFFRDPDQKVGVWIQHGKKKGEWTLSPTQKGGYIGEINGKKWRATLVVEKLVTVH